jgi:uncharacterized phage protein gp47/JayE
VYNYYYEGARPAAGTRFFWRGEYFRLYEDDGALFLAAETPGSQNNEIEDGTPAVPVNNIAGLDVSNFGSLAEPAADTETDDDYRQRIREKIAGPARNGNKQHYKSWCEETPGVGRARIIPLFAGENTVMGVLFGIGGEPAVDPVVERVQNYIDPITLNVQREYNGEPVTVGDGLGNGVANIGAHFLAVPASPVPVDVSFAVTRKTTSATEQVTAEATEAIGAYLKDLALNAPEEEEAVVRISTVGALIHSLPSVLDYKELTLNGATANIEITMTQVAVLGEVTVVETV